MVNDQPSILCFCWGVFLFYSVFIRIKETHKLFVVKLIVLLKIERKRTRNYIQLGFLMLEGNEDTCKYTPDLSSEVSLPVNLY